MKKVLFVAYYFPPDGGAGTQRSLKFCKYLPDFGWTPTVLTREPSARRGRWDPEDSSLLAELPKHIDVIRIPSSPIRSRIARVVSDMSAREVQTFFEWSMRLVREHRFDAVFITTSPFGLATISHKLNVLAQVPVILDLRDPWALDGWKVYRSKLHWIYDVRLMRHSMSNASGVVANTPEAAKVFAKLLRGVRPPPIKVIPNGFDASDFNLLHINTPQANNDAFTIVHNGTLHTNVLYPEKSLKKKLANLLSYQPEPIIASGRTEYFLYQAIRLLKEKKHPLGDQLRFVCVGQRSSANDKCVKDACVESSVSFTGYLEHKSSLDWIARADALFLPLHDLPSGSRSLIVPGKTYEYLASGKLIIAALPPGDARDLLERSGNAFIASPRDVHGLANCLTSAYESLRYGLRVSRPPSWIHEFERFQLTKRLAQFLGDVTL